MVSVHLFVFVLSTFLVGNQGMDPDPDLEKWCEGNPADVFFLLDTSSSITHADFAKQREFVQDLISVFDFSNSKTRVAVSTFSTYYQSTFGFEDYDDKRSITDAIGRIRHRGGNTNTGDAIHSMAEEGFYSARNDVVHIAFVLTDGKSQLGDITVQEAARAKADGIYIYAIGIGSGADTVELRAIGSEPSEKFVYQVPSFSVLHELKQDLAATACKITAQKDESLCKEEQKADIIYTFDSLAMGAANSRKIYNFIANTSDYFNTSHGNIKTGVLSKHCPENDIALDRYDNKYQIVNSLGELDIHKMEYILKELRHKSFLEQNGGRNEARHAAILFIDNETTDLDKVRKQAMYAKFNDIEMFVVNIGEKNKGTVLEDIASKPPSDHIWNIESFDDLDSIQMDFVQAFC